jgi:N-acetylornithine carbamoyltransferase
MGLFGKHLICTQEWSRGELDRVLELARRMKQFRYSPHFADTLRHRTFFMFFFNPSVRTRQSFECAATELGGHAQFLEPKSMRLKTAKKAGETVEDAAKVMSRYACGLGIRMLEDKVAYYGQGDELIREHARHASIPIVSMAHDRFHPCQGLADVMGLQEHLGDDLRGKKILITWAHGALARSHCSVQEAMLICSRYGMDVTVAHPKGYDLDPEVLQWTRQNCKQNESKFELVDDPAAGYTGAHVVYSRNWMSPQAYKDNEFLKQAEIEKALQHTDWICDSDKMAKSENALYTHPMPIDRGHEVTDAVASGDRSIIYDVAENRLHVQKAIMALTMGDL